MNETKQPDLPLSEEEIARYESIQDHQWETPGVVRLLCATIRALQAENAALKAPTPDDEALAREAAEKIADIQQDRMNGKLHITAKGAVACFVDTILSTLTRARAPDRAEIERLREALKDLADPEMWLEWSQDGRSVLEWRGAGEWADPCEIARTALQESTDAER